MQPPSRADRFLAFWARRRWRGFLTLRRLLNRPVIEVATTHGGVFTLHPEQYIDRIVVLEGFYEPEVLEALRPYLVPGAVLWDIGANFGLHAVTAALVAPGTEVHAFEPNPVTFARLEAHARRNGVKIRAWPLALADQDGTGTLHVNAGNPGMTTLTPASGVQYSGSVDIPLARAAALIERGELPAPHVIKLDVEGGEAAVLAGFGEKLRDPVLRAVVFETRADLLDDPSRCPAASQLLAAGFQLRALQHAASSTHALNNFLAYRA